MRISKSDERVRKREIMKRDQTSSTESRGEMRRRERYDGILRAKWSLDRGHRRNVNRDEAMS